MGIWLLFSACFTIVFLVVLLVERWFGDFVTLCGLVGMDVLMELEVVGRLFLDVNIGFELRELREWETWISLGLDYVMFVVLL